MPAHWILVSLSLSLAVTPGVSAASLGSAELAFSLAQPADDPAGATRESEGALAKQSQNPIANLISLPLQLNVHLGVGPDDDEVYVLNVQPVIPFELSEDWNLITRTIVPLISTGDVFEGLPETPGGDGRDSASGLGDVNFSAFFSPRDTGSLTWGVGPAVSLPTATDDVLGSGKVSLGPTGVVVWTEGPWVLGGLARQVWSVAGDSDRDSVSQTVIQPFVNYNLDDGWYLVSAPVITANWSAPDSGDRWMVPLGGGAGRTFRIGSQPVNVGLHAYYNIERPDFGPDWSLRFVFQFLFPK
jgi:hypothetical protein